MLGALGGNGGALPSLQRSCSFSNKTPHPRAGASARPQDLVPDRGPGCLLRHLGALRPALRPAVAPQGWGLRGTLRLAGDDPSPAGERLAWKVSLTRPPPIHSPDPREARGRRQGAPVPAPGTPRRAPRAGHPAPSGQGARARPPHPDPPPGPPARPAPTILSRRRPSPPGAAPAAAAAPPTPSCSAPAGRSRRAGPTCRERPRLGPRPPPRGARAAAGGGAAGAGPAKGFPQPDARLPAPPRRGRAETGLPAAAAGPRGALRGAAGRGRPRDDAAPVPPRPPGVHAPARRQQRLPRRGAARPRPPPLRTPVPAPSPAAAAPAPPRCPAAPCTPPSA